MRPAFFPALTSVVWGDCRALSTGQLCSLTRPNRPSSNPQSAGERSESRASRSGMTRGRPRWLGARDSPGAAQLREKPTGAVCVPLPPAQPALSLRLGALILPVCPGSPSALLVPRCSPAPFAFIPSLPGAQKTQSFPCNSSSQQVFEATCFPPRKWSVG